MNNLALLKEAENRLTPIFSEIDAEVKQKTEA
jgi:hypothetical protein